MADWQRTETLENQYQSSTGQPGAAMPEGWTPSAGGGDASGIDMSQVPSTQEYIKGQISGEDVAFQEYLKGLQGREQPLDIYGRLETEAGIPALRTSAKSLSEEVNKIEDYLYAIEPNVTARTRESLVTEAQRSGMVAAERKPWIENLTRQSTALGRIWDAITRQLEGVGTKVSLALKGQEMEMQPLELKYQTLVERNSRLLTGFTQDKEVTLKALYDKLERTRYLSDREWQQANELAKLAKQHEYNMEQAKYEKETGSWKEMQDVLASGYPKKK